MNEAHDHTSDLIQSLKPTALFFLALGTVSVADSACNVYFPTSKINLGEQFSAEGLTCVMTHTQRGYGPVIQRSDGVGKSLTHPKPGDAGSKPCLYVHVRPPGREVDGPYAYGEMPN